MLPQLAASHYPGIKAQQIGLSGAMAPKVGDFPRLLGALGDFMLQQYDWSAEIPALKMPVMLVYGDGDMFRPEHVIKFYQLLGGSLQGAGWGRETLSQNRELGRAGGGKVGCMDY